MVDELTRCALCTHAKHMHAKVGDWCAVCAEPCPFTPTEAPRARIVAALERYAARGKESE